MIRNLQKNWLLVVISICCTMVNASCITDVNVIDNLLENDPPKIVNVPTEEPDITPPTSVDLSPGINDPSIVAVMELASYSKIEILPNDIMMPAKPLPENAIQSLVNFGGGGGGCSLLDRPAVFLPDDTTGQEWIYVTFCNYQSDSVFNLEITKPSGGFASRSVRLVDDELTQIIGHIYCIDPVHLLEHGSYNIQVYGQGNLYNSKFHISSPIEPSIYVSQPTSRHRFMHVIAGCASSVVEGEELLLLFDGFLPGETVQILLYGGTILDNFGYITYWGGTIDENGRLIQYMSFPSLPFSGQYQIVVLGTQRDKRVSEGFMGPDLMVSAYAVFLGQTTE